MQETNRLSRRSALTRMAAGTAALGALSAIDVLAAGKKREWKIGACDWSLGKACDPEAFEIAKQVGLDGVQVSLGSAANDMRLRTPEAQKEMLAKSAATGIKVASLAIGELNNVPYKSDPRTIPWVEDSADAAKAMGVKVVLLAFFSKNDLRDDPAGTTEVVKRLKTAAARAEKAGVVLGIESWLSAQQHLDIIDRVGSKAVQVYYDVCNSSERGYDIFKEIRMLGRDRICEFHAKENGYLLGKGKVDFVKVRDALDDIGYRGWIQIEGAVPPGGELIDSYKHNCSFMRELAAGSI